MISKEKLWGGMIAAFVALIVVVLTVFIFGGSSEPEAPDGPPWFVISLLVFVTIVLVMKPKPGTKQEELKSRWLTAIAAAAIGSLVVTWSIVNLAANDWQFGVQKKLDVTPHFAESVGIGDPTGSSQAFCGGRNSVMVYKKTWSELIRIPNGCMVDWPEELDSVIEYVFFDEGTDPITPSAYGFDNAKAFKVRTTSSRWDSKEISLFWSRALR